MPLRPPPGRAGRLWLERRIEVARRGGEVLDEKRRALLRLERAQAAELEASRREWEREDAARTRWVAGRTARPAPE